jgi:putative redox protein
LKRRQVSVSYRGNECVDVSCADARFGVHIGDASNGRDSVGCPTEMVASALGACIVLTMAAAAVHKGLPTAGMAAHVEMTGGDEADGFVTRFVVAIELDPSLDARGRAILLNSARTCTVQKLLTGRVEIDEHAKA